MLVPSMNWLTPFFFCLVPFDAGQGSSPFTC
jgi:hypothetical protein